MGVNSIGGDKSRLHSLPSSRAGFPTSARTVADRERRHAPLIVRQTMAKNGEGPPGVAEVTIRIRFWARIAQAARGWAAMVETSGLRSTK